MDITHPNITWDLFSNIWNQDHWIISEEALHLPIGWLWWCRSLQKSFLGGNFCQNCSSGRSCGTNQASNPFTGADSCQSRVPSRDPIAAWIVDTLVDTKCNKYIYQFKQIHFADKYLANLAKKALQCAEGGESKMQLGGSPADSLVDSKCNKYMFYIRQTHLEIKTNTS